LEPNRAFLGVEQAINARIEAINAPQDALNGLDSNQYAIAFSKAGMAG